MAATDPYREAASKILEQAETTYENRPDPLLGLRQVVESVSAPEKQEEPKVAQEDPNPEEPEVQAAEEAETEGEAEIQSLDELVQGLGWGDDATALDSLTLRHKVNGEIRETTLGDALSNFRRGLAADSRLEDAKRMTGELAAERERYKTEHTEKLRDLDTGLAMVEQLLVGDREALSKLDPDDPDYTRQRWALEDRAKQVQDMRAKISQHVQKAMDEARVESRKRLPDLIPEWASQSTMQEELRQLDNFLLKRGFSQQEVASIVDPKAVALVRDAMLYSQAKAGASKVKEKVKPTLRISKPGARQDAEQQRSLKLNDQMQRLRKTKRSDNRELAAEILKERLGLK